MAIINLIDGEKGGVGKSWVARTMIQYCIDNNILHVGIETDRSNPTLFNIYKDCKVAFFSENEKLADNPDLIFDYAFKKMVVVNLPAQVHRAVSQWIDTKGLLELGKENNISFVKWFVSDGESDSIELFINSLEHYQGYIPHVFIKNMGRCDEWEYFNNHEGIQKAIEEYGVSVIDFPKLGDAKRIEINAKRMMFSDAVNYAEFGIIGRNQIKTFLRNAYSAFDDTNIFTSVQKKQVKD
ncbi:MAG: mobilization protein MobD-like protein [Pseudanabaena sp. M38BS1SP1A06MG]|nr:mobilization protein MobD-like protein [Pseudanabaena sp. M53BS1SP1A06MG]MCA6592806.1 mobilization protein MobD-like protein [Pseudanabaena sp. M38BS1SP1A06MG]